MSMLPIRRALVSVYHKTGVVDFCRELSNRGCEILSTGGTARALREAGIAVKDVSEHTGFPEMMDGRVKTLHPRVHGGLLALRDNPEHMKKAEEHEIGMIDMVVCNLYPFEETAAKPGATPEEIIEQIDIGGPSMVRSAAKNHAFVAVVTRPGQYDCLLEELKENDGKLSLSTRKALAAAAFESTAAYDSAIAHWMASRQACEAAGESSEYPWPQVFASPLKLVQTMRYGENPHQHAAFYGYSVASGTNLATAKQISGKELSYNNLLDSDGALRLVLEFSDPAAAVIKHSTPCGAAIADDIVTAFVQAYDGDPVSAFGGIVALNRPVDAAVAKELTSGSKFLEVVLAPSFTEEAIELITGDANPNKWRKSIRLIAVGEMKQDPNAVDPRGVLGGVLLQTSDTFMVDDSALQVVTKEQPSAETMRDLKFAWRVVKHVKSNGIAVCARGQLLGAGGGQTSRVEATEIALNKAGTKARGAALASDAFFPFLDSVEIAANAGISAIIQPGGSVRDKEVIAACNAAGIAMVLTGNRHFRH